MVRTKARHPLRREPELWTRTLPTTDTVTPLVFPPPPAAEEDLYLDVPPITPSPSQITLLRTGQSTNVDLDSAGASSHLIVGSNVGAALNIDALKKEAAVSTPPISSSPAPPLDGALLFSDTSIPQTASVVAETEVSHLRSSQSETSFDSLSATVSVKPEELNVASLMEYVASLSRTATSSDFQFGDNVSSDQSPRPPPTDPSSTAESSSVDRTQPEASSTSRFSFGNYRKTTELAGTNVPATPIAPSVADPIVTSARTPDGSPIESGALKVNQTKAYPKGGPLDDLKRFLNHHIPHEHSTSSTVHPPPTTTGLSALNDHMVSLYQRRHDGSTSDQSALLDAVPDGNPSPSQTTPSRHSLQADGETLESEEGEVAKDHEGKSQYVARPKSTSSQKSVMSQKGEANELRDKLTEYENTIADMKVQHVKEVTHLHEQITNLLNELGGTKSNKMNELALAKAEFEKKTKELAQAKDVQMKELDDAKIEIANQERQLVSATANQAKELIDAKDRVLRQAEEIAALKAQLSDQNMKTLQAVKTLYRQLAAAASSSPNNDVNTDFMSESNTGMRNFEAVPRMLRLSRSVVEWVFSFPFAIILSICYRPACIYK
ncbi:hypothetical protein EIP91_008104 [Steccherinum ochraceum]|uniref:Uncharacterized protein n=1 Tax=Steccherinum ochraceum TaxID=92696 RepID=A0A4R0R3F2_9APHY|nr:hypothetical protein EIP91_008104 [Steccherinum ochraceum]